MTISQASDRNHNGGQVPGGRPRRLYRQADRESANGVKPIYGAALEAHEAGLSAIPASEDGNKRPFGGSAKWKVWQAKRSYPAQLKRWFSDGHRHGMGLVCGAISDNLEMFEFKGHAVTEGVFDQFLSAATEEGLGELIERIRIGYEERAERRLALALPLRRDLREPEVGPTSRHAGGTFREPRRQDQTAHRDQG